MVVASVMLYLLKHDSLNMHKKSVHDGVTHECDQCVAVFTQQANLYTHKKSVHGGVRYECDQCDTVFMRQGHLNNHNKNTHEGVTMVMVRL